MTPWVLEGAVLPDRGVRECVLCPPWFECAHLGDQVVRLVLPQPAAAHANACETHAWWNSAVGADVWEVVFGTILPGEVPEMGCVRWLSTWRLAGKTRDAMYYTTEAEARAEFERRCAIMRGDTPEEAYGDVHRGIHLPGDIVCRSCRAGARNRSCRVSVIRRGIRRDVIHRRAQDRTEGIAMTYWLDIAPLVVVFAGVVGLLAALVWPRKGVR